MDRHRVFRQVLLAATLVALAACAKLPRYAQPGFALGDDAGRDATDDRISYRELRRDDFRGEKSPRGNEHRLSAVTCVSIRPDTSELEVDSALSGDSGATRIYDITLKNLRYEALMDRGCSWWNPNSPAEREAYILEHEQIHFALYELAARRWSRLPPPRFRIGYDTTEEMQENLRNQYRKYLRKLLEEQNREQYRFDEETSIGYHPEVQRRWRQRVRAELEATGRTE